MGSGQNFPAEKWLGWGIDLTTAEPWDMDTVGLLLFLVYYILSDIA